MKPTQRDDDKTAATDAAAENLEKVLGDAGPEVTLDPLAPPTPNVHQAIVGMMREIDPIVKAQKNSGQGGYLFRGIDDVYNFVHPHLCKWGVYLTSEIIDESHTKGQTSKGNATNICIMRMRYKLTAEDGTFVTTEVSGEATDSNDKSTAKALSMAYKYAFFQLLCIPIEQHDPDAGPPKHPNPPANASSPKVKPRGQRSPVVQQELIGLFNMWQEQFSDKQRDDFRPWVADVLGVQFNFGDPSKWTREQVTKCYETLGVPE